MIVLNILKFSDLILKIFSENRDEPDDEELLDQYRKFPASQVIAVLYKRYMHLVYGLCLKYLKSREDAQDAVMNIFETITEKLKTHKVEYFKSWLYMVAKNHCLMELRKRDGTERINGRFMENELVVHPMVEDTREVIDIDDDLNALERCIEELRPDQQLCVKLFYLQQKSYREIVEKTAFKLTKVKSYIQNGKRNLKICLEKNHVTR